jgi:hypothetical protein
VGVEHSFRAPREEWHLAAEFSDPYREHQRSVPVLVPSSPRPHIQHKSRIALTLRE